MEVNAHGSDCPRARATRQLRLRSGTSMKRFLAVLLLMPSIAVAATDAAPTSDLKAAERFAKLALACVEKEYRSEEHTSELQSQSNLVCRLLLEKKKKIIQYVTSTYT